MARGSPAGQRRSLTADGVGSRNMDTAPSDRRRSPGGYRQMNLVRQVGIGNRRSHLFRQA
jgi:hypothetical protein